MGMADCDEVQDAVKEINRYVLTEEERDQKFSEMWEKMKSIVPYRGKE